MRRIKVLLLLLLLPGLAFAEEYQLTPALKVVLPDVSAPWKVSTEPPVRLIDHLAEHVRESALKEGKQPTDEQIQQVALKRAKNNQLFVINQKTGAHLLISFSALKEGEGVPSSKAVSLSARYAAEGVADEGWKILSSRHASTEIKGARSARWFAIDYAEKGVQSLFMGLVGFAQPYWFWFYGNDHLQDPADQRYLENLMLSIEIKIDR